MPWLVIDGRQRDLMVSGAESGHPTFTREADRALRFSGQGDARKWLGKHIVSAFGELALTREAGDRDTRKGQASHYGSRTKP